MALAAKRLQVVEGVRVAAALEWHNMVALKPAANVGGPGVIARAARLPANHVFAEPRGTPSSASSTPGAKPHPHEVGVEAGRRGASGH